MPDPHEVIADRAKALRPVLVWPDARLRGVAEPVTDFSKALADLAQEMLAVMYAAPGRGLAATQIGVMQRLFVMDCTWKEGRPDPQVMVNPEIVWAAERQVAFTEGCLSLPGLLAKVERPEAVTLRWHDLKGTEHQEEFTGFAAVCVQHERDHLDGILCIDRLPAAERSAIGPALAALAGR